MTALLICGSRDADLTMLGYAHACVARAHKRGFRVIVGDAEGVDSEVLTTCLMYNLPFRLYGIRETPRNGNALQLSELARLMQFYTQVKSTSYLQRDRVMVDNADIVMAIWNGKSRGTKYTYDYAVQQGKVAHLRDFSDEAWVERWLHVIQPER